MTRKEIIKALRCCNSNDGCRGCPLEMADLPQGTCVDKVLFDAADMLEQDVPPTDMIPKDYHDRCMEMEIERRMLLEQNAPKWISVKERMPQPNERVLAYFPGTRDSEAVILPSKGWAVNKFVSYCMPLPEPPKEKKA